MDPSSYDIYYDIKIGNRIIVEREGNPTMKFNTYDAYIKYKMALANRK